MMTRKLAPLVVIAHWIIAVSHLFLVARILPVPYDKVSWLGITFITVGHWAVAIVLWALGDKISGIVAVIFFLLATSADLYEHFLHASPNNLFDVAATGNGVLWFDASVIVLLALEIVGCLLGIMLIVGRGGHRGSALPDHA
jgi:hypothetical protein